MSYRSVWDARNLRAVETSWSPGLLRHRLPKAKGLAPRARCYVLISLCDGLKEERRSEDINPPPRPSSVIIKPPAPSRTPLAPPVPVPVERSTAYLVRSSRQRTFDEEEGKALDVSRSQQHRSNTSGNALEWVLQKVDETLDDVEESPPAYATAIYKITTGPVGEAASKGASIAAKLTLQAGTTVVKAAVPVGKWVIARGFKAAAGAVFKGVNKGKGDKGKE